MENLYPSAIRRLRAKLNISQTKLAKMIGVSFSSVNRWENGKHEPTIKIKRKLNRLFDEHGISYADSKNENSDLSN